MHKMLDIRMELLDLMSESPFLGQELFYARKPTYGIRLSFVYVLVCLSLERKLVCRKVHDRE
jgi:hypothetical protein